MYEIDTAGLPQVSQEAVDIINAVVAGLITPWDFKRDTPVPKNIETSYKDLDRLFNLKKAPPGFEDLGLTKPPEEELFDPTTVPTDLPTDIPTGPGTETGGFDPNAVSLTDGSLQQELAFMMQTAVDTLRENVGESIEQFMIQFV